MKLARRRALARPANRTAVPQISSNDHNFVAGLTTKTPKMRPMRGWIAIVALDESAGATYRPAAGYGFSDHTPHHRHVGVHDIFFVRSQTQLLAIARVQKIETGASEKAVQRCPVCGTGQLGLRARRTNKYRCLYGHEFSRPASSVRNGAEYRAVFGHDFIEVSARIEAAEMRAFELTNSRQLALRPCDLDGLMRYVARRDRNAEGMLRTWLSERPNLLADGDADLIAPTEILDEREHRHLGIRLRRGRKVFRDELLRRYGARCMITGCTTAALIEAAYIQPESVPKFNNPTNGLLLRSDLHTLFDLNLLGIDPTRLTSSLHPSLRDSEYWSYDGAPLVIARGRGPNRRALAKRWRLFEAGLTEPRNDSARSETSFEAPT